MIVVPPVPMDLAPTVAFPVTVTLLVHWTTSAMLIPDVANADPTLTEEPAVSVSQVSGISHIAEDASAMGMLIAVILLLELVRIAGITLLVTTVIGVSILSMGTRELGLTYRAELVHVQVSLIFLVK